MIMIATSTLSLLMQSSQRAISTSFEVSSLLLRKSRVSTSATLNLLSSKKMSSFDRELKENSKTIFLHSLSSVAPQTLIRNVLRREDDVLYINDVKYTLNRNLYLLGFGKAVLGMACEVVQLSRDHLQRGVLSIPAGLISPADDCLLRQGNIEVHEGSVNNLPDGNAMIAALETEQLVKRLDEKHLLLTLISGGGSALLPLPVSPILLREKSDLIQQLSESGASITELNTVRKKLSVLKGGGLARLAAPAQTVSLILSDVIGDPIDYIASGPTIENKDEPLAALNIIHKYNLSDTIPKSIKSVLESIEAKHDKQILPRPENIIIGNNRTALNAAVEKAKYLGYFPIVLSDSVQGNVVDVCSFYASFIKLFDDCYKKKISTGEFITALGNQNALSLLCPTFCLDEQSIKAGIENMQKGVCFVAGGEPTVVVRGQGKGGRNQELALRMTIALNCIRDQLEGTRVCFLSAGTDGIDGHTDAAGAFAYPQLIGEALEQNLHADNFIKCNDSFTFYSKLQNGENLIYTGHTGTNVMDIHVVIMQQIAQQH